MIQTVASSPAPAEEQTRNRSEPATPAPVVIIGRAAKRETPVFGVDWLRRGIPIEKETSVLKDEAAAIAAARTSVAKRHPGREPDSFRLTDATGRILGVFPVGSP
jgi:hypothetical protein